MKRIPVSLKTLNLMFRVAEDAEGNIKCNCTGDGCEGTCTHALATDLTGRLYRLVANTALEEWEKEEKQ